jgi:hypothetical protein
MLAGSLVLRLLDVMSDSVAGEWFVGVPRDYVQMRVRVTLTCRRTAILANAVAVGRVLIVEHVLGLLEQALGFVPFFFR